MGQLTDPAVSQYDEPTQLWFTRQIDADGRLISEVKGKELSITKTFANDRLTLEVRAGSQSLSIAVAHRQIEIKSGRKTVRFDPAQTTESQYDAVKNLLGQSRVVGRLRSAVAGLSTGVREGPGGFDLLATEALVALLDGDPTAAQRLKERIRGELLGVGVQPARRTNGECFDEYKREQYLAFLAAENCVNDFSFWNVPAQNLCYLEWLIRLEASWFEFLGCSIARAVRLGA
jgi:hypothetical protein